MLKFLEKKEVILLWYNVARRHVFNLRPFVFKKNKIFFFFFEAIQIILDTFLTLFLPPRPLCDIFLKLCYIIQAGLVICGLFIFEFKYMQLKNGLSSGTYPLIYNDPWSFYMRIYYMRAYFWSPYLSHITRSVLFCF